MCIGDWRLGTLIRTQVTTVSLAVASTIITPNAERVGIMFKVGTLAGGAVPELSVDGVLLGNFLVGFSPPAFDFTLATHGDLPTRQFTITNGVGTATIGVLEMFMPQSYITAGLNEFKREYPDMGRLGR